MDRHLHGPWWLADVDDHLPGLLAPKTPLFALKSKLRSLPMPWRDERWPAPIVHFRRGRAAGSYQLQVRQRLVEFALVSLPDFAERQTKLVLDHPHQVGARLSPESDSIR